MTYAQGYWDGYTGIPARQEGQFYQVGYLAGTSARHLTNPIPMLPCHHDSQTRETGGGKHQNAR